MNLNDYLKNKIIKDHRNKQKQSNYPNRSQHINCIFDNSFANNNTISSIENSTGDNRYFGIKNNEKVNSNNFKYDIFKNYNTYDDKKEKNNMNFYSIDNVNLSNYIKNSKINNNLRNINNQSNNLKINKNI